MTHSTLLTVFWVWVYCLNKTVLRTSNTYTRLHELSNNIFSLEKLTKSQCWQHLFDRDRCWGTRYCWLVLRKLLSQSIWAWEQESRRPFAGAPKFSFSRQIPLCLRQSDPRGKSRRICWSDILYWYDISFLWGEGVGSIPRLGETWRWGKRVPSL